MVEITLQEKPLEKCLPSLTQTQWVWGPLLGSRHQ